MAIDLGGHRHRFSHDRILLELVAIVLLCATCACMLAIPCLRTDSSDTNKQQHSNRAQNAGVGHGTWTVRALRVLCSRLREPARMAWAFLFLFLAGTMLKCSNVSFLVCVLVWTCGAPTLVVAGDFENARGIAFVSILSCLTFQVWRTTYPATVSI